MSVVKRIVCLANSRKLAGRCVAGVTVDTDSPEWIRPVSARPSQEVSEYERAYENGRDPAVLDVIDVPLLRPMPGTFQRENWLLDPERYWTLVRRASWQELGRFAVESPLWVDGYHTFSGLNDEIPERIADSLTTSLILIHVPSVELRVLAPGKDFGNPKQRLQARFTVAGSQYRLWVTDPVYERRFLGDRTSPGSLGECYLTVSIGEPYKGACYKLVAAVVEGSAAR